MKELGRETVLKHCKDLQIILSYQGDCDIDGIDISEELGVLLRVLDSRSIVSPIDVLNYTHKNSMAAVYPNVFIALRIFLTLPVTVASAERSFSKLKLIKKLSAIING